LVDLNGYFNIYKDFIGQLSVVNKDTAFHKGLPLVPGTSWRPYTNLADKVYSYGVGLGLGYMITKAITSEQAIITWIIKLKMQGTSTAKARDLGFNASKHQVFAGISGTITFGKV
jgi:hypothetical protein